MTLWQEYWPMLAVAAASLSVLHFVGVTNIFGW